MDRGVDPPEKFINTPQLIPGLFLYYTCFWELIGDRQLSGMGSGPITWNAIHNWCRWNELSRDQEEECQICIKAMDAFYLEHTRKKENDRQEELQNANDTIQSGDEESG